ncbi:MAG TPA: biotin--protein ligase [Spirochaetes bacterium]|nr:biotin--protein ligase [Spirochaetota bacterium]
MALKSFEIKRENEKLLRVAVDVVDGALRSLELSGDFFIHPEEGVETLQARLIGLPPDEKVLAPVIKRCLAENAIELVGLSAATIAAAIARAR